MIPCNRLYCRCTHTDGCEGGFIAHSYIVKRKRIDREGNTFFAEMVYDGVQPCPVCDPERARIVASSRSSVEIGERLRERSVINAKDNYEKNEMGQTRTL